ncbi:MAG: LLM class F420-dependent oxidoreductase [Jatrophihabitans sp.]|nr:MAG: LLM class F420-dependent oxidoreductase [Jatrophihabitans sp.]
MRIGIVSPIVVQYPGVAAPWEAAAGIRELAEIASVADEVGLHHLTCSEHVAVPVPVAAERGGTYWDPLATFGYLAAVTTRIRLVTQVLVLGYHHPLEIAKRYGTLDTVSGGRLVLGVGVGTLREEFALLGAPFEDRGARADEALRALRASLGVTEPAFEGEHYRYRDLVVSPCAVQPRVPLWIGGRTPRSLRRAVALGDGWAPFGLRPEQVAELLGRVDRPEGFEVVLGTGRPLDPLGDPDRSLATLRRLADAGATVLAASIGARSCDHYCDQLQALARLREAM